MYAHGFRGTIPELTVDPPPLPMRAWLVANGFAWAASSYTKNYYDVRSGVESTNDLARFFSRNVAVPERTFITGFSMGGHVTGAAIEQFPNVKCPGGRYGRFCRRIARILGRLSGGIQYSGAAPFCGVMGDLELFNYFGDFARGSEALAGVTLPELPPPDDYFFTVFPIVLTALGTFPNLTEQGLQHKDFTEIISGGPRPGFDAAFGFWDDFLFAGNGGGQDLSGVVSGSTYDNIGKVYQFDVDPSLSEAEVLFNETILRAAAAEGVNPRRFLKLQRVPEITGRLSIPVVSTHTLGDLFVPFSMQQIYAREAASKRRDQYLVTRATRAIGHCEFTAEELVSSLSDMIDWANGGPRPSGDDVLDVDAVADPQMGCAHSEGFTGSRFAFEACPAL